LSRLYSFLFPFTSLFRSQVLLFVLVGAQVNIALAFDAGFKGIILIGFGLLARSLGVLFSLIGTELNKKEKLFSIIAYLPKATVRSEEHTSELQSRFDLVC